MVLIGHGLSVAAANAQDISVESRNISMPTVWKNTNPFDGAVDEEIIVGDAAGNLIPVPIGHQVDGTLDGKWIQVKDKDGVPTGTRKDGGGHSREKDIRGRNPHGHVPGIANPDGTPWLGIH
ncbi:MAG: hypothetical protein V4487_02535 [Chlamydiota bacterium]